MKNSFAVVAGLISAFIIFLIFESASTLIFPMPEKIDATNLKAMETYIESMPSSVLLIILAGYAVGSFVAGMVIGKISKSPFKKLPLIAGIILTAGGIYNLLMIPHPLWFVIINLIIYVPLTIAGNSVTGKENPV